MDTDIVNGVPPSFAEDRQPFPWVNVALFVATIFTTLFVGTMLMGSFNQTLGLPGSGDPIRTLWTDPSILLSGLPFSIAIMSIFLAHEMGHYLTCRYYGISATLPYFIPAPTLFGTFGAFIRIRSPFPRRAELLDVGVAGPIAGFVLSVPILVVSLTLSRFVVIEPDAGSMSLGEPLIFKFFAVLMQATPPPGMDLYLHPIGFAAWVGFFLTALNLIPVGQLDGGHISYALFGRHHRRISQVVVFALLPLGIFAWPGWLMWIVLLALLGTRHPPTVDDTVPLESRHVVLAWIALAMLVLCFTPFPLTIT